MFNLNKRTFKRSWIEFVNLNKGLRLWLSLWLQHIKEVALAVWCDGEVCFFCVVFFFYCTSRVANSFLVLNESLVASLNKSIRLSVCPHVFWGYESKSFYGPQKSQNADDWIDIKESVEQNKGKNGLRIYIWCMFSKDYKIWKCA